MELKSVGQGPIGVCTARAVVGWGELEDSSIQIDSNLASWLGMFMEAVFKTRDIIPFVWSLRLIFVMFMIGKAKIIRKRKVSTRY